ncbi:Sodium channel protein Nach [Harpegnathos saltator]|uniref:Sodium channel protein Nach n=1 Tax=Harpegnathos saltator TaxID=610380 RepID=E2BST4_HARSA|nr:Sodium channel protein Nach [Harpegnathos saltator]
MTEVLYETMPRCDELMSNCWWRNGNRDCCEIFEVQRTEYGFCYSFNSELAEPLSSQTQHTGRRPESRPRRASGYGEWSGVKVTMHLGNITKPPDSVEIDGIVVMINWPHVWPNSGTMIPSGSLVSLSVDCISGFATQGVLELDESRTPCKYDETGIYNQETCLSHCKRTYVIKHCGCNPSFLFPLTSERDCNVEDFICLADFNVSFGGIIGLFLGGSLLSAVELLYYVMVAAFSSLYSRQRTGAGSRMRTSAPIVRTTVLPILDYGPLKPPARRIPIFANYGLAKSNLNRY